MRRTVTTTLDQDLYQKIQILALKSRKDANDFIEEGMKLVLLQHESIHQIADKRG